MDFCVRACQRFKTARQKLMQHLAGPKSCVFSSSFEHSRAFLKRSNLRPAQLLVVPSGPSVYIYIYTLYILYASCDAVELRVSPFQLRWRSLAKSRRLALVHRQRRPWHAKRRKISDSKSATGAALSSASNTTGHRWSCIPRKSFVWKNLSLADKMLTGAREGPAAAAGEGFCKGGRGL